MLQTILAAILPEGLHTRAARRAWMAAILLFPIAFATGFFLLLRTEPRAPVPVTIDRAKAVEIARAFALREGVPASFWSATRSSSLNVPLLHWVNAKSESDPLWRFAPPLYGDITLTQPGGNQSGHVYISVDGKVLGFQWKNAPVSGAPVSDSEALRLAAARLPADLQFSGPAIEKKGADRLYTFHSSTLAGVDLKAVADVAANRVTSFRLKAEPATALRNSAAVKVQNALSMIGGLLLCVAVIFSVYRYATRTIQQEVSHQRSLVVALLCGCFCILIAFNAVVDSEGETVPFVYMALVCALIGLLGGALIAAAYGSGEGDVREAYPGKLTSLDALLTGRVFSRNVGVSVLFGLVSAGWLMFTLAILTAPFRGGGVQGSPTMLQPFQSITWPLSFVSYPLLALTFASAALLQPLAFLSRNAARARRWRIPALLIWGGLIAALRQHTRSLPEFLAGSLIFVLALLIPFFLRDLLAALVCIATLSAFTTLTINMAQLPADITTPVMHGAAAALMLLFAVACVRHGKTFSEEQVRPLYARHIAERKSLEAEVSAAREAQLRLLPPNTPDFAGLSIAAACVPAETVGGDFYDFFSLGEGRLGIFIADGNNHGLAAALTIALAKGYLMHCVEKFREPAEIIARLETALASIFESASSGGAGSDPADFAFAVIDTVACEVRYARTGAYPKVVIASSSGAETTERLIAVKGRLTPIAEGCAPLSSGDHVVLFTDGIGRRLAAASGRRTPEEVAGALAARGARDAQEMRERFLAAAKSSANPDDLTVVVVRMQAEQASALGVVA